MVKLLIFILAVAIEIFCIKVFNRNKSSLMRTICIIQALNVLWCFGRVLGLVP